MEKTVEPHKSSLWNMDANLLALLVYLVPLVLGFITLFSLALIAWVIPLIVFLMEKKSDFVRFHAMQCLVLYIFSFALGIAIIMVAGGTMIISVITDSIVGFISAYIGTIVIYGLVSIVLLIVEVIAMIKAYNHKEYHIPVLGKLARGFVKPLA